ncbi:MAG: hypothetical protein LBI27_05625 [Clostridiales bacterium]|jgi:uncharacterized membrane protein YukC|nr:hypothetical protein [Clostridiales bacterium]
MATKIDYAVIIAYQEEIMANKTLSDAEKLSIIKAANAKIDEQVKK